MKSSAYEEQILFFINWHLLRQGGGGGGGGGCKYNKTVQDSWSDGALPIT